MLAQREMDDRLAAKGGVSDLVQETFLEAHRDIDRFRGRTTAQFRAWLRTILRHNLSNFARQYRGPGREAGREVPITGAPGGIDITDGGVSPSGMASEREQLDSLRAAIGRLPERDRKIILWRHQEQIGYDEIGRRLGMKADAARIAWARAVKRVQDDLGVPETEGTWA